MIARVIETDLMTEPIIIKNAHVLPGGGRPGRDLPLAVRDATTRRRSAVQPRPMVVHQAVRLQRTETRTRIGNDTRITQRRTEYKHSHAYHNGFWRCSPVSL